jgi:hypothetical protein
MYSRRPGWHLRGELRLLVELLEEHFYLELCARPVQSGMSFINDDLMAQVWPALKHGAATGLQSARMYCDQRGFAPAIELGDGRNVRISIAMVAIERSL